MVGADADPSLTADEAGQLAMLQTILVGVGAGAATALLFASLATGSILATLLFYLAPLPVMIAGLGWSHVAALVAALVAAAGLAAAFGGLLFAAFLIGLGLPAWWLSYLALLARPAPANPEGLEWYPVGRLVLWAALLGALGIILAIPMFGTDAESFQAGLRQAFERLLRAETNTPSDAPLTLPGVSDPGRFLNFLVLVTPPVAAVVSTVTSLANLWLAGRIVKLSGRLKRSWPDVGTTALPRYAAALLAVAIAGMLAGDLLGTVARVLTASLLIAYALVGLAVVHATTRGVNGRGFVLAGIYAAVAVFGWPVLLLSILGLADVAVDFRRRVAKRRGLPETRT
jgi:hypothetical protein